MKIPLNLIVQRKIFIILMTCLFLGTGTVISSESESRIPERIILNPTIDPTTSQAVTWRTGLGVETAKAQITISKSIPELKDDVISLGARTDSLEIDEDQIVLQHSVIFDNLRPNTLYAYRVGDGKVWSEWNHFSTAQKEFSPFKFLYFGDPQNDIKSMCSRVFRTAYSTASDARFWVFAGDIVNHGDRDDEWGDFFYSLGWISSVTPFFMVPGNHGYIKETVDGKSVRTINHLWRKIFTLPENGPSGLEETAYYIDYQGVRFISFNGNEKLEEQAQWLEVILSDNPNQWTIVNMHQPIYSTAKNRNNPELQKLLIPIFDKYSVDLVLQGHDHTYGRTYKLYNGNIVPENEKGTVYIVSVSGTKVYSTNPLYKNLMARLGTGHQLFQVISIDNNILKYQSITATGEIYDSFELIKFQ